MDLSKLDTAAVAEQGVALEITHPITGEALGITVILAGSDSATYRKAQAVIARKRMRGRSFKPMSPEEVHLESVRLLTSCTLNWSGVELEGATLPCTEANAEVLYRRFPWLYEQADQAMHDRSRYLLD